MIKKNKNIKIGYLLFVLILIIFHFLAIWDVGKILSPIGFLPRNLFIFDLIGKSFFISRLFLYFFEFGNLYLIWCIGKYFFNKKSFIPLIVYGVNPWAIYLTAVGSFYIYLLFVFLSFVYSLILIKSNNKKFGGLLLILSFIFGIGSSFFLLFLLPFLMLIIYLRIIKFKSYKSIIFSPLLLIFAVFVLSLLNLDAFKIIVGKEIKVFADPGFINMVNVYRGEAVKEGLGFWAKIAENKYLFGVEFISLKFMKHFVPATFFTQQEKLLGFSFSPPIFLGFIIPFVYGGYKLLKESSIKWLLYLSVFLAIPSVLSSYVVDLDRLVFLFPVLVFVISYGIILMVKKRKEKSFRFFWLVFVFLILFQFFLTVYDLPTKEKQRFIRYYGENFELVE